MTQRKPKDMERLKSDKTHRFQNKLNKNLILYQINDREYENFRC